MQVRHIDESLMQTVTLGARHTAVQTASSINLGNCCFDVSHKYQVHRHNHLVSDDMVLSGLHLSSLLVESQESMLCNAICLCAFVLYHNWSINGPAMLWVCRSLAPHLIKGRALQEGIRAGPSYCSAASKSVAALEPYMHFSLFEQVHVWLLLSRAAIHPPVQTRKLHARLQSRRFKAAELATLLSSPAPHCVASTDRFHLHTTCLVM